ncbi:MAG TPA: GDCCVxC domain-containing (seleno)protein [Woeseiaceae bacterium]|nr:GDCCVxC domain-containing (seleno)protein [Woeseiaceae bacterium]
MPNTTAIERYSTLTCPECGNKARELMPTNACQFYYDCAACGALLRPIEGDCCVYCSYGDVKCPPIQQGSSCCDRPGKWQRPT